MSAEITIFQAKKIVTMNPSNPEGTHVAVREERILGVGSLEEVAGWGEYDLDDTFKDKVLIPGFVEAHAHTLEGAMWAFPYVGFFDRLGADGTLWKGCKSIAEVVETLKRVESQMVDPDGTLLAWGVDPLLFPGERMTKVHLDQISTTRPIFILHASGHLATVNSALLRQENITRDAPVGVAKGPDGEPNGELQEIPAMSLARTAFHQIFAAMGSSEAIWRTGYSARNCGVTTTSELGAARVDDAQVAEKYAAAVNDPEFPARFVVIYPGGYIADTPYSDVAKQAGQLSADRNTEKMRFSHIKITLDGSNQGFTGQIQWPGYYKGEDAGQWLIDPAKVKDFVVAFHRAGFKIHAHCNGNAAAEVFIDAVETALQEAPRWDHRHSIEHCQTTTPAQYRRMAALGIGANLFANHIYFWGDQHRDLVFGPERAKGMNAAATAKREGVPFSLHSDANVTPLGGLLSMWSAVNRLTATGKVLASMNASAPTTRCMPSPWAEPTYSKWITRSAAWNAASLPIAPSWRQVHWMWTR